jgi:hypothetical protein
MFAILFPGLGVIVSVVRASTRSEPMSPVVSLHREMNRLFDDAFAVISTGHQRLFGGPRLHD